MDDLQFGTRDKGGNWRPSKKLTTGPLFELPPNLKKILAWLPGYFVPWNALFFGLAAVFWFWLTPAKETMETLAPGWIAFLLVRNMALVFVLYGLLELRLYIKRRQNNQFKYNGKFPADTPSSVFMFKSQNFDNAIRTFGTGLPIWTAYEVVILWCYANGWGPWATFIENPVWLIAFGLALPMWHEFHFFCTHRLIHIPFLYKHVHSVHHNSVNPSPWSSLSMHPVEHLIYWSDALIHLVLPSHPLLVLYNLQITGTGAFVGHIGFDKIVTGDKSAMDTHAYAHYLHHKYFEVNYADGGIPFDRWFGTWHDGSPDSDAKMEARLKKRRERLARKGAGAKGTSA